MINELNALIRARCRKQMNWAVYPSQRNLKKKRWLSYLVSVFYEFLSATFNVRKFGAHLGETFLLVLDCRIRYLRRIEFLDLQIFLENVHLNCKLTTNNNDNNRTEKISEKY
jgi:hypothetical protein